MTFYTPGRQTAGMPADAYLRKIEQTNIEESPDLTHDYQRGVLLDMAPDAPWLEDHESRGLGVGADGVQRQGSRAASVLNMRHGGRRTLTEPWLPEGLFFNQFTDADPRGTSDAPDMTRMVDQSRARSRFHVFRNDADNSVMEAGVNPAQMQENRRGRAVFYDSKTRFRNFSESLYSWAWSPPGQYRHAKIKNMITGDGATLEMEEEVMANRTDATTILSNDPTVAFRHGTTDHRVTTSDYGQVRAEPTLLMDQDWHANRQLAMRTHDMVELNGELVNRALAQVIVDLQNGRRIGMESMTGGQSVTESGVVRQRAAAATPEDMIRIAYLAQTDTAVSSHQALSIEQGQRTARREALTDTQSRRALVTHEIAKIMAQANRRTMSDGARANLQRMIDRTATAETTRGVMGDGGSVVVDVRGVRHAESTDETARRYHTVHDREIASAATVTNYSAVAVDPTVSRVTQSHYDFLNGNSTESQRRGTAVNKYRHNTVGDHAELMEFPGSFEIDVTKASHANLRGKSNRKRAQTRIANSHEVANDW